MWDKTRSDEHVRPGRQTLRILVAEDHAGTRRVLGQLLRWLGCQADMAEDGQEALEVLRLRPYDVVLMDIVMPRMDGIEATRRIRIEHRSGPEPMIVGMSADTMPEDREVCFSAGMDEFLPKPINVDSLIQILDMVAAGSALVH